MSKNKHKNKKQKTKIKKPKTTSKQKKMFHMKENFSSYGKGYHPTVKW